MSQDLKELPDEMKQLVEKLVRIHGPGRVSIEDSGRHLSVASPKCLEEDGLRELGPAHRHLSINLDKYFKLGIWKDAPTAPKGRKPRKHIDSCALCMKFTVKYRVSELLNMKTIEQRGYKVKDRKVTTQSAAYLIDDGKGNMIPDHPGKVTPVILLPPTHPARVYLASRDFTPQEAWKFCRLSYCYEAAPEGEQYRRFYRRMTAGTKSTNSERIIFYIDIEGVQRGWQARYLEQTETREDGSQSLYHWLVWKGEDPAWVEVARRASKTEKWEYHPDLVHEDFPYSPDKYRNAGGQNRNGVLMGLDSAVKWNEERGRGRASEEEWSLDPGAGNPPAICILMEGPTDGIRIYAAGGPAVAVMGKHLSDEQADLIAKRFQIAHMIPDGDRAGAELQAKVKDKLTGRGLKVVMSPIPEELHAKDPGELTRVQAKVFVDTMLAPYNLPNPLC